MAFYDNEPALHALMKVIWEVKPDDRPLPMPPLRSGAPTKTRTAPTNRLQERFLLGIDCDEVYPNIFVGDEGAARNKEYLEGIGITHVINTAQGNRFGQVHTNADFYKGTSITFKGLRLLDIPETKISVHFSECADFIESALNSGGKVLVHCLMGMSRSSTIALAYLMIKKGLTAEEALRTVRQKRDIRPNDGFLRQLCELDSELHSGNPTAN